MINNFSLGLAEAIMEKRYKFTYTFILFKGTFNLLTVFCK